MLVLLSAEASLAQNAPGSVEAAEKAIAKDRKARTKVAKKAKKQASKEHWARQSKSAKKSLKRNKKRNKKIIRVRNKNQRYQEKMNKRHPGS